MSAPAWLRDLIRQHDESLIADNGFTVSFEEYAEHLAEVIAAEMRARLTSDEAREAAARGIAQIGPSEGWPTNEALGGGPTGTRDDEYLDMMHDQAADALAAVTDLLIGAES